jgi:hypothetical protein
MTVYSSTARFDNARALTQDEMYKIAPSIFAVQKHESRSERFRPIPTIEILKGLEKEGFVPVGVKQSNSRDSNKRDFTKHLVRLRRIDGDIKYQVGDTICEILLKNANDGTSAYELMAGLFRITCLNSMVAQKGTLESTKVYHSGNVQDKVIEGTYRVLNQAEYALSAPQDWSKIILNHEEKKLLADAAKVIRFGEIKTENEISSSQMLVARRAEDVKDDLWTVFNRIQENVIKGGIKFKTVDNETGRTRMASTRQVNAIDQDIKLNRALWHLTTEMAKLKK